MTPTQRILLSRKTLALYERMPGPPAGPIEATLALIAGEIVLLEEIAVDEPRRAETLAKLVVRWRAFGDRVKAGAN